MKPKTTLSDARWISWPQTQDVMGALINDGQESALFVGGCVRNALLGMDVTDIDIATIYTPGIVKEKLAAKGIRAVDTGIEHGTITAIKDNKTFEITTLRKDIKTDGRHAVVAFTDDWAADAHRRDFTMNALFADINGQVFDPTGRGIDDLKKKRVVFVGDAHERIKEDFLRILRFFRFYGLYGAGEADESALAACKENAHGIKNLSKERIGQEFFKILTLNRAADILTLMFSCDVLKEMTQAYNEASMQLLVDRQCGFDCVDIYTRYLLLTDYNVEAGRDYMVFANKNKTHMKKIMEARDFLKNINTKEIRASVYWHGNAATLQAYLLKTLSSKDSLSPEVMDVARYWRAPEFPVTGEDLMAQGYVQGPELGSKLKAMERAWVENDFVL